MRKNVLEQQILCTEDDLITLGGLALQAEIGDFKDFVRTFIDLSCNALWIIRNSFLDAQNWVFYVLKLYSGEYSQQATGVGEIFEKCSLFKEGRQSRWGRA